MKKEGVLFLCQFFYPEKVSSATLPFDTAEAFAKAGYKVGALCGYPFEYVEKKGNIPLKETVNGVNITRLRYLKLSRKNPIGRLINYFSLTAKALFNVKKLKEYEYVVVYSNPPILPYVAYKAKKKYGTKIIFVCYDVYPEIAIKTNSIGKSGLISRIMTRINGKIFPEIDKLVVLSDDMKEFMLKNRPISNEKITVIPNWFNRESFSPKKKNDEITVTYLGNLGICQDIQTLLDAALESRDDAGIKYVIGGHGKKTADIKNFIGLNGLSNVEIKPFLTGEEYEKQMESSDCFIVSLEKWLNGLCFPSKYYSYLAYGRPIISVGECNTLSSEIMENNIGYCVENGNSTALIDAVRKIREMGEEDFERKCAACFNLYKNRYDRDICVKKYVDLISGAYYE